MFDDHNDILNSYPVLSVLIEARLVRHAHAFLELGCIPSANTARAFMNAVERADSVACSMVVVNSSGP